MTESNPKIMNRRVLLALGLRAGASLGLSGLALLISNEAEARRANLIKVNLDYQTILGDSEREDRAALLRILADNYGRLADFYSRGILAIPEDAVIQQVKPKHIEIEVDINETKLRNYTKIISESKPKWDEKRDSFVVHQTVEFDLRCYVIKKDQTLKSLVDSVAGAYPTQEEKAQALLCFVQTAIQFDSEKMVQSMKNSKNDYVRNPKKTLLDKKGDCKDTSVLYASLLAQMGVNPVFLFYNHHINIGVPLDFEVKRIRAAPEDLSLDGKITLGKKTYYIAETTPELPMYIGKLMIAQQGKKIEKVIPIS